MALGDEAPLERVVAPPLLGIGSERVAEDELPLPVHAAVLHDVDVVRARVALPEVQASGKSELTEVLVPEFLHRRELLVGQLQLPEPDGDVDDRLGTETGNRGAADVLDRHGRTVEHGEQPISLLLEPLGPGRIVVDEL
jgi:hypothetical protein